MHVLFDHPNRFGHSPKQFEQNLRDKNVLPMPDIDTITDNMKIPRGNWQECLANRAIDIYIRESW